MIAVPLLLAAVSSTLAGSAPAGRVPPPLVAEPERPAVKVVYFVPRDRAPVPDHAARITVLLRFVADLYARDFQRKELPARAPAFEVRDDGLVDVVLFRGAHDAAHYTGAPEHDPNRQWSTILPEVERQVVWAGARPLLVFAETYEEGPHPFEFPGGVALGGRVTSDGGAGLFSAWILRDEFCATTVERQLELLTDATPIPGRTAVDHGGKDSPRFEFIEDGFGAVAHELGHALGLPHDLRNEDWDIMGNGFRNLRRDYDPRAPRGEPIGFSLENARLLAAHRVLANAPDLQDDQYPRIEAEARRARGQLRITGTATDDHELIAAVLLEEGQVRAGAELKGERAKLAFELPVEKDTEPRIEILVIDRGGNLRCQPVNVD